MTPELKLTKKQKEFKKLSHEEKKIYRSVMAHFPATSHDTAIGVALQGGIRFQFISK